MNTSCSHITVGLGDPEAEQGRVMSSPCTTWYLILERIYYYYYYHLHHVVLLLRFRQQSWFVQLVLGEDNQVDRVGREVRFPGEVVAGSARVPSSVGRLEVLGGEADFKTQN